MSFFWSLLLCSCGADVVLALFVVALAPVVRLARAFVLGRVVAPLSILLYQTKIRFMLIFNNASRHHKHR